MFLAKGFVQCKRKDPKLGECIKNSLQSAIPHLIKGTHSGHKLSARVYVYIRKMYSRCSESWIVPN